MRRWITRHCNYATIVSLLAVFTALGGTAYAAATYTTKHVKNASLTTKDVKNATLSTSQIHRASLESMRKSGTDGPKGPQGARGAEGPQGYTGAKGTAAKNAYAWSYNVQSSLLRLRSSSNGSPPDDWYSQMGTGQWTRPDSGYGGVLLELADGSNDGLLQLERPSIVYAMADLTAWHEDATVNSRLECRLRITDIVSNSQRTIGQPVMVATGEYRRIIPIGLVGGLRMDPGTYAVKAECRDLDLTTTSYAKWYIAKGNLSVLSAYDWYRP